MYLHGPIVMYLRGPIVITTRTELFLAKTSRSSSYNSPYATLRCLVWRQYVGFNGKMKRTTMKRRGKRRTRKQKVEKGKDDEEGDCGEEGG